MQRSLGDGGYEDIEREKVVRGRLGEMGMRWALEKERERDGLEYRC